MIAPYTRKENIATDIDEEIKDVFSQTGDNGVIPNVPRKYINFEGEKYSMSAEQYTEYKKTYGQTSNDLLEDLFRTNTYKQASSEERADMINDVYEYAGDLAKKDYLSQEGVTYSNATVDKEKVYKESNIKNAISNDMSLEEFDFYDKNPDKYNFLQDNEISYKDYTANKEVYNYAYENPDKYAVGKAVTNDFATYYSYIEEMNDLDAKDENGNSVNGLKKERVFNYINSLDLNRSQKAMMFKMQYPKDNDYVGNSYNNEIINYIRGLDMSYEEKVKVLNGLGMTIKNNRVYWD
jgi:hypothetical protein